MSRKYIFLLLLSFLLSFNAFSASFKGKIKDAKTNEPLVGATILLKNTKMGSIAALDGSFEIKNLAVGSYEVVIQYIGYEPKSAKIEVKTATQILLSDFLLNEQVSQLAETIVSAKANGENDEYARKTEQKSDNVLNVISAKTIQLLPDITVGNILQRVSGVSVVRNSTGDGQYAVIRGMDKRYNYTSINGVKIPSPDNKNRYVPMDIFPADLLERLEVVKALTPNMEGDAIGGAMNMVMKSVPDYLILSATATTGYSQLFSNQPFAGFRTKDIQFKSPSEIHGNLYAAKTTDFSIKNLQYKNVALPINSLLSLSVGNRIFNHKLGFLLGGSYQHTYRGSNSSFFNLNGQPSPDPLPNSPLIESVQKRIYSNEQARLGLNLKLDYAFNSRNRISLYNLFMQLDDWQHRHVLSNQLTLFGDVGNNDRSVFRRQNIYNSTLQGEHTLAKKLKFNWSTVYSLAKSQTPDWTDQSVTSRTSQGLDGKPIESARYIDNVSHIWTHNEDRDLTGYIHLIYSYSPTIEFSSGGMYRDKDRSNFYNNYSLATVLPGGERQIFTSIEQTKFTFRPESFAYADSTNANNYTAKEKIGAGYLQAKVNISDWQILGGVRVETTNQSYVSQLPVTATGKTGKISYMDILPSLHIKYKLSERENVRISYFKGITRPGYFEIVPATFPGEYFNESGNYKLKHTQADNIDLRYEFFPRGNEQLLLGAFLKNIKNPIEFGFSEFGNSNFVYTPLNFGTAKNYGAEIVFTKYLKNWGVSGNYTYTHSRITTTKRIYGRDTNGSIVNSLGTQTRPLQGQSDHIGNLSLIYKNSQIGLDAQLSWVYTGKRINIVSPYKDLDYWQRGTSQVDFSTEKKFGKTHFSAFAKLTNLLNNPIIVEVLKPNTNQNLPDQTRTDRILVQKDILQQSYSFGIRYKH
ncbi:collagen-binding protein [Emticicia aquatilis]|uniref:Collagen-binding protein n=1 Tax=Emticicia aquatilis TaxID=1537369 RepID=A0A916Z725_9BACT|nr:TonB-dependent receptor [Emticicia aquatilis]GGD79519.1 collagen-binding protein [Emticicia aquatilis]